VNPCIFWIFYELLVLKLSLQVAASHLDTVLEKLKTILDSAGQSAIQRYLQDTFGIRDLSTVLISVPILSWQEFIS
jgi:predicted dinucleotide-utilizing enzyme